MHKSQLDHQLQAAVDMPSAQGYHPDHFQLSYVTKAPAYTMRNTPRFGKRLENDKFPGPGAHEPYLKLEQADGRTFDSTHTSRTQIVLPRIPRFDNTEEIDKYFKPSPATYPTHIRGGFGQQAVKSEARTCANGATMGSAPRFPVPRDREPGPGDYDTMVDEQQSMLPHHTVVHFNHAHRFGPAALKPAQRSPGPSDYSPKLAITQSTQDSRHYDVHGCTIPKEKRLVAHGGSETFHTPGPADHHTPADSFACTFHGRRSNANHVCSFPKAARFQSVPVPQRPNRSQNSLQASPHLLKGSRALRASDDGSFLRTLPTSRYASPMNPSKHSGYYPSNAAYGAGGDLTWPGPRSRLQRAPDAGLLTGAPEGTRQNKALPSSAPATMVLQHAFNCPGSDAATIGHGSGYDIAVVADTSGFSSIFDRQEHSANGHNGVTVGHHTGDYPVMHNDATGFDGAHTVSAVDSAFGGNDSGFSVLGGGLSGFDSYVTGEPSHLNSSLGNTSGMSHAAHAPAHARHALPPVPLVTAGPGDAWVRISAGPVTSDAVLAAAATAGAKPAAVSPRSLSANSPSAYAEAVVAAADAALLQAIAAASKPATPVRGTRRVSLADSFDHPHYDAESRPRPASIADGCALFPDPMATGRVRRASIADPTASPRTGHRLSHAGSSYSPRSARGSTHGDPTESPRLIRLAARSETYQTREAVLLATRRKIEEMNRCTNVRRGTEEHRRMTAEEHRRTAEEWRKISPHGAAGVAAVEHMLSTTLEVE